MVFLRLSVINIMLAIIHLLSPTQEISGYNSGKEWYIIKEIPIFSLIQVKMYWIIADLNTILITQTIVEKN